MRSLRHLLYLIPLCALLILRLPPSTVAADSSIYEILKRHALPMGLLPKGVKSFSFDNSGKFEAHLDRPCNSKFENELHYDANVSGIIRYGRIGGLSGISAQDLFLWFPVVAIHVDIPSSGVIYFNVSVVSKQFSLSAFENPRDCLAAPDSDLQEPLADKDSEIRHLQF